jgi:hypothetical protein
VLYQLLMDGLISVPRNEVCLCKHDGRSATVRCFIIVFRNLQELRDCERSVLFSDAVSW